MKEKIAIHEDDNLLIPYYFDITITSQSLILAIILILFIFGSKKRT